LASYPDERRRGWGCSHSQAGATADDCGTVGGGAAARGCLAAVCGEGSTWTTDGGGSATLTGGGSWPVVRAGWQRCWSPPAVAGTTRSGAAGATAAATARAARPEHRA